MLYFKQKKSRAFVSGRVWELFGVQMTAITLMATTPIDSHRYQKLSVINVLSCLALLCVGNKPMLLSLM